MWSVLLIDLACGANNWTGYDSVYGHERVVNESTCRGACRYSLYIVLLYSSVNCAVGAPTVQCGVYKMYLYDSWPVNPYRYSTCTGEGHNKDWMTSRL